LQIEELLPGSDVPPAPLLAFVKSPFAILNLQFAMLLLRPDVTRPKESGVKPTALQEIPRVGYCTGVHAVV
jgi:hypothetical protein